MGWPITRPSVIYAIRCKTSSRVYIGRTYRLEARLKEHFSELRRGMKTWYAAEEGRHISQFQKDYNKYGEENFQVYILEKDVPPEKCKEREAFWIDEYHSADPRYGYNRYDEHMKPQIPPVIEGLPPKRKTKEPKRKTKEHPLVAESAAVKEE